MLPDPHATANRLATIGDALDAARVTQDHERLTDADRKLLRGAATALRLDRLIELANEADAQADPEARHAAVTRLLDAILNLTDDGRAAIALAAVVTAARARRAMTS